VILLNGMFLALELSHYTPHHPKDAALCSSLSAVAHLRFSAFISG
jgi:hypothetical protein